MPTPILVLPVHAIQSYINRFRFGMPRVPIGSKLNEGSLKKVADANRIYDVPQISEI